MIRKKAIFGGLLILAFWAPSNVSSQGTIAFAPAQLGDDLGLNSHETTRGWGFNPYFLGVGAPVEITSVGVYDSGGNGLANTHEVGIWSAGELLASTVIPAGTVAQIIDGYRYAPIGPIILPRTQIAVAAHYSAGDSDGLLMPSSGQFADRVFYLWSGFAPSPTLTFPNLGLSTGEGKPNAEFVPVNFQFQVVPEPNVAALFVLAASFSALLRATLNVGRRDEK